MSAAPPTSTGLASGAGGPLLTLHIVTLFPRIFDGWLQQGVVSRAIDRGIAALQLKDLRPHGLGRHLVTDDYPFGGGAGMLMKPEPLFEAVESLQLPNGTPIILLSPCGRVFDQRAAIALSTLPEVVLIAGHYEGVDERVRAHLVTDEISVGDFVLSSGELAAMVVTDAIVRLLRGTLAEGSAEDESFSPRILEYPHYTRPATYRGWSVPDVLLSGHHGEIARWRRREALRWTRERRPELLEGLELNEEDSALLAEIDESHMDRNPVDRDGR